MKARRTPAKVKWVFEFRYLLPDGKWLVDPGLFTRDEAAKYFHGRPDILDYQIHRGPVKIPQEDNPLFVDRRD